MHDRVADEDTIDDRPSVLIGCIAKVRNHQTDLAADRGGQFRTAPISDRETDSAHDIGPVPRLFREVREEYARIKTFLNKEILHAGHS